VTSRGSLPDRPTLGLPIAGVSAYLLDAGGAPVEEGTPGEICLGGVSVARGYLNRPDLTAERFVPDPFAAAAGARMYRTGDLGRRLPSGEIAFQGRIDDQIELNGHRIEPMEIEHRLNQHPLIDKSLVTTWDGGGERCLVAYVVVQPDAGVPSRSVLRSWLQDSLPAAMVPGVFVRLDDLVLSANGKAERRALPPPDAANMLGDSQRESPPAGLEARVVAMVGGLLGRTGLSGDDNFLLLGGHSLFAAQLIARTHETFGVSLTLRAVFDAPTIAELATTIARLGAP
jgi:acyl-coenzyme A synthetase/AMP-(fatty) acid ligase